MFGLKPACGFGQVSDIMSNMVEAGWLQQYEYDKLMTLTEAAQVRLLAPGSPGWTCVKLCEAVCSCVQLLAWLSLSRAWHQALGVQSPAEGRSQVLARMSGIMYKHVPWWINALFGYAGAGHGGVHPQARDAHLACS